MGSPGCGKTTLGRILSSKLDRPVIDIDDDHLEPLWGMPVSEKVFSNLSLNHIIPTLNDSCPARVVQWCKCRTHDLVVVSLSPG